ncbi:MAG: endonuclease VIII [Pseudomonadota bacterium]
MPEGPEIRLAADRIANVLVGQRLEDVQLGLPKLRKFGSVLLGATTTRIDTRGKAMLTYFDNDKVLYTHNQLYGRWYVCARGEMPSTNRQLRVALHTAHASALLYSASDIELLDANTVDSHPFVSRLGPDILDSELRVEDIEARLLDARFANRALASLYLDQRFLAGNGNYLRSEILFFASLAITRKPSGLSAQERRRLAQTTLTIARRSYRTRGITNPPALVKARKAAGNSSYSKYRFAVFGRDGHPCDACGSTIQRDVAASRRIYFCAQCQS